MNKIAALLTINVCYLICNWRMFIIIDLYSASFMDYCKKVYFLIITGIGAFLLTALFWELMLDINTNGNFAKNCIKVYFYLNIYLACSRGVLNMKKYFVHRSTDKCSSSYNHHMVI